MIREDDMPERGLRRFARRRAEELGGVLLLAAAFLIALAFTIGATGAADATDAAHRMLAAIAQITGWRGWADWTAPADWLVHGGILIAASLWRGFGGASLLIPFALMVWGWRVTHHSAFIGWGRLRGVAGLFALLFLTLALSMQNAPDLRLFDVGLGGIMGDRLATATASILPARANNIAFHGALYLLAALCFQFALRLPIRGFLRFLHRLGNIMRTGRSTPLGTALHNLERAERRAKPAPEKPVVQKPAPPKPMLPKPVMQKPAPPKPVPRKSILKKLTPKKLITPKSTGGRYSLPPLTLLTDAPRETGTKLTPAQIQENAAALEAVLQEFSVSGQVLGGHAGPVVTLYEFEPAPGVKSSRVVGLSDDIARSMSATAARVAVIPGRNAIGIELPNPERQIVHLRSLLGHRHVRGDGGRLPLALGKSIGGEMVVADLARMPHLLIAGTTGSGKSVAINTMILSLLYRLRPQECRMILIDPKMLELSVYEGIPHLLTPVVTEPKKAVRALRWAVREMEERYRIMSEQNVRNLETYNARMKGTDKTMPLIVIVVDEMADLMLVAGKEIEATIQRLAQMARAAGIHIIMATQRPSVDVITGTIKANFPTRISFQVSSKIDSRTILGEQGAEQLLGQGDMLFMRGAAHVARVHGPFVSDSDVEAVADHLRAEGAPEYREEITAPPEEGDTALMDMGEGEGGEEGLYAQALKILQTGGRPSTSFLQRKLQIGYNRAARLMEKMEEDGIVSAPDHAGKRHLLESDGT